MSKKFYIVTVETFIGHDQFNTKNAFGGLDIRTICKSFEDAHTYIDRSIALNIDANDRECGKGAIACRVDTPEFFEGREVDVYFTDTRNNKKWMWVYSVYERSLFDPKKENIIRGKQRTAIEKSIKQIREGHYYTLEEFKQKMEERIKEREKSRVTDMEDL